MQIYDTITKPGHFQPYRVAELDTSFLFYPLIMELLPRIAEVQEVKGCLTLIHFDRPVGQLIRCEKEVICDASSAREMRINIVLFGLTPLIERGVITQAESTVISQWFAGDIQSPFAKRITIKSGEYTIFTTKERGGMSLAVALGHIQH
ncbi:MAG: hypothetical protein WCX74_03480 [Candidatus Paceibacterota bacterium]